MEEGRGGGVCGLGVMEGGGGEEEEMILTVGARGEGEVEVD